MENLNTEIRTKILDFLKSTRIGASSSEIAKNIGHNRITVSKYLEIMKAHKLIDYEGVGQAKLWYISKKRDKPTVLIVDDEPHVVDLIALSLIPEKYNMLKAYSGLEALDLIHKETPDLVILDLMMPGINGYEVCQQMKENALTQHIPVIILSAKGQVEDKLKGLKIGADDYITKPFDPMELEARVERLIRRTVQDVDTHPLTKLPGKAALRERLNELMREGEEFSIHSFTIQGIQKYNNKYGYKKGEQVLTLLSRVFSDLLKGEEHFIAHTVQDEFVVIAKSKDKELAKKVRDTFKGLIPYFFKGKPRADLLELKAKSLSSRFIYGENLKMEDVFRHLGLSI